MKKRVAIIGAGGHGKVIADAVLKSGEYELVGFVDAKIQRGTVVFGTYPILESQANIHLLLPEIDCFIIGIGANEIRKKVVESLPENLEWATVIHPSASIASETIIAGCSGNLPARQNHMRRTPAFGRTLRPHHPVGVAVVACLHHP